jgi:hypothetical protein
MGGLFGDEHFTGDVLIEDERIAAIGPNLGLAGDAMPFEVRLLYDKCSRCEAVIVELRDREVKCSAVWKVCLRPNPSTVAFYD